jgi:hypothetical protein
MLSIGTVGFRWVGTGRARGLTVVTGNVAEFGRVEVLSVEDWAERVAGSPGRVGHDRYIH